MFFTNLIPGYRKDDKSTGGFKAAWITEKVKTNFSDLINILSPKVELEQQLGKYTYLYPLPHPGYFGKMNRGAEKMEVDWERLSDWMEKMNFT